MSVTELNKKVNISVGAIGLIIAGTFSVSSILWKFNENGLEIENNAVQITESEERMNGRLNRKFEQLKEVESHTILDLEKLEERVREVEYQVKKDLENEQ